MLDRRRPGRRPAGGPPRSQFLRTALTGLAGFAVFSLTPPTQLQAQETETAEPRIGCFRGQRIETCSSFWLIEMQALTPLAQTSRVVERGSPFQYDDHIWHFAFEWNVGHMWNVNRDWAFGGMVTASTQPQGVLGGLRARARRWITDDLSVESAIGYTRVEGRTLTEGNSHGMSADLRLNIRDQGAFFLRWDYVNLKETPRGRYGDDYFDPGGAQHALNVGVGSGSVPALIGTGTLLVGLAILIGLYISADT